MGESIYPWNFLEEGGGDLAKDPREDEGESEEGAVGEAGGAPRDRRRHRRAEAAGAARAAGRQARRGPHVSTPYPDLDHSRRDEMMEMER